MGLNSGKHIEKEINGVYSRIIETGISKERADFLSKLLKHNGVETVVVEDVRKNEDAPVTYTLATPDLTFNPVIAVYERRLFTEDGHRVTPDYWNQKDDGEYRFNPNYWDYHKKPWFLEELKRKEGEKEKQAEQESPNKSSE